VLDGDTRPSAPEPGAEVTFSRRGLAAGQHLIDVHDHYRAELAQVRDLLARVAKGITAAGQARGELNRLTVTDTLLSHFAYEESELAGPLARYGFYPGQL
jgi:hypothetical protein